MRILLVEDDTNLIAIFREVLKSDGHEVFEALNGLEAVDMASEIEPDLILMDIQMPVMDGIEATTENAAWRLVPSVGTVARRRSTASSSTEPSPTSIQSRPFSPSSGVAFVLKV